MKTLVFDQKIEAVQRELVALEQRIQDPAVSAVTPDLLLESLTQLGLAVEELQAAAAELRQQPGVASVEEYTLLRGLIDAHLDPIFIKDTQSRFVMGNAALAHSIGVATPDELIGKTDFEFHPPELAARYYADEQAIFQSDQPLINREEPVVYSDDEQRWHLTTKVPLRDREGKIIGLAGIARDITDRKRVEEQLRARNELVQKITHASPHLIYIYDLRKHCNIYVNDQISTILGYTPVDIQSMASGFLETLIHPDDLDSIIDHFHRLMADTDGSIFESEYRAKHANGEWRWLRSRDVVFSRDVNGRTEQILGTAQDITERKQAEESLRESEAFNRAVLNSLVAHIAVLDREGVIIAVNEAWQHFAYQNGGEALMSRTGVGVDYLDICRKARGDSAEEAHMALVGIEAVMDRSLSRFSLEYSCHSPEEEHWFVMYVTPLSQSQGGAVVSHVDITERRQAEAEKVRLLDAVSQQRELLRALARRLAEAQETERKDLARELHDRVGQNLTALDFNLHIIRTQLAEIAPGSDLIQERLNDSLALVAQTTDLVRDVMVDLRPPVLDEYGLTAALQWYRDTLVSRVEFAISVQGEEPSPRLAPEVENALFRITQEALTNVVKHAQASQVTVSVETEAEMVRLVIADNGVGFGSARRAIPAERPGLGLISMAERAEAVGGHFQLVSQPGEGTRVIVEVSR